jgi:hypothetical protein
MRIGREDGRDRDQRRHRECAHDRRQDFEARGATKQAVDGRRYRGHVSLLCPNRRCFQPSNGWLVGMREAG